MLRQAQVFMSDVSGPPESEDEQRRLTNTLHALEHASRLAEAAGEKAEFTALNGGLTTCAHRGCARMPCKAQS